MARHTPGMKRPPRLKAEVVSADERDLFLDAVRDAAPLPGDDRVRIAPPPPRPDLPASRLPATTPLLLDVEGERVRARAPGVSVTQLAELARGLVRPEETLDLHGNTVAAAETRLTAYLLGAVRNRRRCVLIVHGQGLHAGNLALLRDAVVAALLGPLSGLVHAFATAMPKDGGPGSTYVMVRT